MSANKHARYAEAALADVCDAEDNASLIARAQAEALIAIAEELRTANLLAAAAPVAMPSSEASRALHQAHVALGINITAVTA